MSVQGERVVELERWRNGQERMFLDGASIADLDLLVQVYLLAAQCITRYMHRGTYAFHDSRPDSCNMPFHTLTSRTGHHQRIPGLDRRE